MPATAKKPRSRSRRKNSESLPNIKRIESAKTRGWQVHLCRGGVQKTKLFSDRVYNGKKKALQAALAHRDELTRKMAKFGKPLWRINRVPRSNTGHLGVSYIEVKNGNGEIRAAVTVTVRAAVGKAVNRKFSVEKLGYEEAVRRAVSWRRTLLRRRSLKEKESSTSVNGSRHG